MCRLSVRMQLQPIIAISHSVCLSERVNCVFFCAPPTSVALFATINRLKRFEHSRQFSIFHFIVFMPSNANVFINEKKKRHTMAIYLLCNANKVYLPYKHYDGAWVWCAKRNQIASKHERHSVNKWFCNLLHCCREDRTPLRNCCFFFSFLLLVCGIPFHSLMGNWTWEHPFKLSDGHMQCDNLREWLTSDSLRFAIVSIFTNILLFSERTIMLVLCIAPNEFNKYW